MACCCGTSGGTSSLPILTGSGAPVSPPDLSTHLPLYRDVTTGELWVWSGGIWSITRAPVGWMIKAVAPLPLQSTDFISINRGGTPGNPDGGDYYVATIQDLAAVVGSIVGATVVQSGDAAIGVSASGSTYTITFEPQGGAAEIAGDATALATLFAAANLNMLNDVSTSVPNLNDALVWNGSQWTPVPLSALTSDSFVNGGSVTGGGTTLTLTYNTASLPPININIANVVPNYDNTTSGLSSTNMQAAIDELAAMFGGAFSNIGTGQPVYAGLSGGVHQLHSVDGANGVSASIQGSTIVLQFDPGSLTPVALQQLATMIAGDATAIAIIAGAINLGDLADVNTAGAANGEVLTYQGGTWVPAAPPSGGVGGATYGTGVLQGICAECFDDAVAQGLQPGDYFLHIGTTPPTLFQWDGTNLNGVSPLPDVFVCCNSNDVYVQCNGQMVGTWAVGDELAHMVMNVFCAVSEADAIALGLVAHQYWLDVSVTPPVLMHYNGTSSTPATFTPRVVNCCNSGDVYIRCQSGSSTVLVHAGNLGGGGSVPAANVTVDPCPVGPINAATDLQSAICQLSQLSVQGPPKAIFHYVPAQPLSTTSVEWGVSSAFNRDPLNTVAYLSPALAAMGVSLDTTTGLITLPAGTWRLKPLFFGQSIPDYWGVRDSGGTPLAEELASAGWSGGYTSRMWADVSVLLTLATTTTVETGQYLPSSYFYIWRWPTSGVHTTLYNSLKATIGVEIELLEV